MATILTDRQLLEYGTSNNELLLQMIANIGLFIPLGFIYPLVEGNSFRKTVLTGLCFSCLIEVVQLITHRGFFEFDDMFYNTIGVMIGYGCNRIIQKRHCGKKGMK